MAITTKWSVNNMTHNDADGGVILVYWSCTAQADTGETAVEAGKLRLEPDASADGFVAYDSLTEDTVLGWVYESLIEGEETAAEAKSRIENVRKGKVDAQVARKTAVATGMPWPTEEEVAEEAAA